MNPPAHLSEKYKEIPFVYLDVPKIVPDDNFVEIWLESKEVVKRLQASEAFPYTPEEAEKIKAERGENWQNEWSANEANFQGISLINDNSKFNRWSQLIVDGYKNFPKLMDQIHTYFPIKKLKQMHCWSNRRQLGLHRDGFDQIPGVPTSLRVMLYDNNPGPTFWMQPIPEDKLGWGYEHIIRDENKIKVLDLSTTPDTNSFCFNNYNFVHAAEKDQAHWKILGMFSLEWEWKGFETLVDRSIEKYGNNLP
jgi:hypothetical protein